MERIGSFDRLAALAERHMRRGVLMNTMITREAYEPDILGRGLTAKETEDGLFLLRDRGDHTLLCFLMEPGAELPALPDRTVCEIPFRERDTGLAGLPQKLEEAGFETVLRRVRLSRPAGPCEMPEEPLCFPESPEEAASFLQRHFSSLTGCLPGEAEMRAALAERRLPAVRDENGALCGLLHFTVAGRASRLRHLAVEERYRNRGLASRLIRGYLAETGGARSTVWTGEENIPAIRAYASAGYSPDGTRSAVLVKK